jgi:NAD(P) transhydrogenase subunit beta
VAWPSIQLEIRKRAAYTSYTPDNPLFFKGNTRMFYSDAKASMDALLKELG